jgi:inosine-uridine nucleoside N-ribohydrolase
MNFPKLSEEFLLRRLEPPTSLARMVLDTDTYNEIDDQFAVAYALLSPERLNVQAIYAAPFGNDRSIGPGDGMEKSYEEILRLLERLNHSTNNFVYRGSTTYLTGRETPERSPAALNLAERALAASEDDPLYVVAIGAIANVASAILLEPEIIRRIVVVWLGGQPSSLHTAAEFNLMQDPRASQILFDCGVPLIHIPCLGVASHLLTTVPELEGALKGRNAISDFLLQRFCEYHSDHFAWAKEIWDISAIAYLLNPEWVPTRILPSPILTEKLTWQSPPEGRHTVREAWFVKRNPIFKDLFLKLQSLPR